MLENVRNLTAHDNGNTFKIIKEHLERLGYHVYAKVLNALDFGVPQKRERIIIVGFWRMWIFHSQTLFQNQRERRSQIFGRYCG